MIRTTTRSSTVALVFLLSAARASGQAPPPSPIYDAPATAPVPPPPPPTSGAPQDAPPPTPPPAVTPAAVPTPAAAAAAPAAPAPGTLTVGEFTLRPVLQARFRYEGRVNPYGDGVQLHDQHFITTRVRVGLDARWRKLRVLAQVQDVRNFGTYPGSDDGTKLGLHQGFLEVGDAQTYLRLGRQEISYGDERMIGPLDWQMAARSFDGLRLHHTRGKLQLDAFGAVLRPQTRYVYTLPATMTQAQVWSKGDYLATFQASYVASPDFALDAYVLYRHDSPLDTAPTRDRDIVSPGVRVTGNLTPTFGYTAEGTIQGGRVYDNAFFAYAASADLRYTPRSTLRPLFGTGFAYGSGSANAIGTEKVDGFENFFPTNHKFYGYADLFNLQNLIDAHVTAQLRPDLVESSIRLASSEAALQQEASVMAKRGGQNAAHKLGKRNTKATTLVVLAKLFTQTKGALVGLLIGHVKRFDNLGFALDQVPKKSMTWR